MPGVLASKAAARVTSFLASRLNKSHGLPGCEVNLLRGRPFPVHWLSMRINNSWCSKQSFICAWVKYAMCLDTGQGVSERSELAPCIILYYITLFKFCLTSYSHTKKNCPKEGCKQLYHVYAWCVWACMCVKKKLVSWVGFELPYFSMEIWALTHWATRKC